MSLPPFMPDPAAIVAYRDAIEADVREQVADEIEARFTNGRTEYEVGYDEAIERAARIARGGEQ